MKAMSTTLRLWLLGLAPILAGTSARADQIWYVNVDTSRLAADYTGPFGLDFELLGSNGNTVTVRDLTYGGGAAGPGSASLTGGASGDLGTSTGTVTMSDAASFFNDFNQGFTPGSTLTFTVDSTLVGPPLGGTPDNFSMVIFTQYAAYDPTNPPPSPTDTPIPTLDPTGNDTFLNFDINGPGATTASSYGSTSGDVSITVTPASVPEPASGLMLTLGLIAVAGLRSLRRR
ncbi:MAG: PEP-CTERM sorting domain-containing protein [Isosphaeraceae bacterium]